MENVNRKNGVSCESTRMRVRPAASRSRRCGPGTAPCRCRPGRARPSVAAGHLVDELPRLLAPTPRRARRARRPRCQLCPGAPATPRPSGTGATLPVNVSMIRRRRSSTSRGESAAGRVQVKMSPPTMSNPIEERTPAIAENAPGWSKATHSDLHRVGPPVDERGGGTPGAERRNRRGVARYFRRIEPSEIAGVQAGEVLSGEAPVHTRAREKPAGRVESAA